MSQRPLKGDRPANEADHTSPLITGSLAGSRSSGASDLFQTLNLDCSSASSPIGEHINLNRCPISCPAEVAALRQCSGNPKVKDALLFIQHGGTACGDEARS